MGRNNRGACEPVGGCWERQRECDVGYAASAFLCSPEEWAGDRQGDGSLWRGLGLLTQKDAGNRAPRANYRRNLHDFSSVGALHSGLEALPRPCFRRLFEQADQAPSTRNRPPAWPPPSPPAKVPEEAAEPSAICHLNQKKTNLKDSPILFNSRPDLSGIEGNIKRSG